MLLKRILPLALLAIWTAPAILAAPVEGNAGEGSIEFRLGYYFQADNGTDGNPFLEEELTVIEPVVVFERNLSTDTRFHALLSYDNVSSASIDRLNKFPDQSGASGDYYFGLELGMTHNLEDARTLSYGGGGSVEYDYRSFHLRGSTGWEDRTGGTHEAGVTGFIDFIDPIRFDGTEDAGDERLTLTGSYTLYQTHSPTLHGQYGASATLQNGFLETAYNAVVIEDGSGPNPHLVNRASGREVIEALPDTRVRLALFGNIKKSLNPAQAIQWDTRLYGDDWGVVAATTGPSFHQWIIADRLRGEARFRYHTQTAADDYAEHFVSEPTLRTQDPDLGDYQTSRFGFSLIWTLESGSVLDAHVDQALRSDGLDYTTLSLGYKRFF